MKNLFIDVNTTFKAMIQIKDGKCSSINAGSEEVCGVFFAWKSPKFFFFSHLNCFNSLISHQSEPIYSKKL